MDHSDSNCDRSSDPGPFQSVRSTEESRPVPSPGSREEITASARVVGCPEAVLQLTCSWIEEELNQTIFREE